MTRQLLALALARFAGQTLTPEVAREIMADAGMDRDLSIDPRQFGSRIWHGYELRAERVAGMEAELAPLHRAYLVEARPHAADQPFPYAALREAERAGAVVQFTAREAGRLVGIMRIRLSRHIHTGEPVVHDDLFYVAAAHRGFLSVTLWRFAEEAMFRFGVREASFDSLSITGAERMAKFLGYTKVSTRFSKVAHDACDYTHVPNRHTGVAHVPVAPQ